VIRYRLSGMPPRRLALGDVRVKSLAKAREEAKKKLADVDNGKDPREARRAEREAAEMRRIGERVGKAVDSWLKDGKLGPGRRWKGGLAGGTWATPHINRLKRRLGDKLLTAQRDLLGARHPPCRAGLDKRPGSWEARPLLGCGFPFGWSHKTPAVRQDDRGFVSPACRPDPSPSRRTRLRRG
jgi:hypothetical protein